ncbi:unnamed protein product [Vitrella brassicaformis CCMP3155]|uniref:D-isomer specific 2-hydroxyacid dehydrogenase NAD-binding domain-containing protein n=1 Tax=Vitrella brassicaformis (strain CCMP3155) TaxID=1169540 RepID=A0A0G4H4J2_VITBC|nr:unnamed protein product [Vitrella brassicaformis CCMP3155]|eukprot:CEM38575.1 unnamed protein product [Vitrella brassicaformis CCMP3155]
MRTFFFEAFEEEAAHIRRYLDATPWVEGELVPATIQEFLAQRGESKTSGPSIGPPPCDVISIRTQSTLPLEWADDLKAILSRSTGYDHLLAYRHQATVERTQHIHFGHLPLYCVRAVAEQAIMLLLSLSRKLAQQRSQWHQFHRDGLTGMELKGKKMVVVGVGNIGSEVCRLGLALGMNVVGVDIAIKYSDLVPYQEPEVALKGAHCVVVCMNLTSCNIGYMTPHRLSLLKEGALFVNISRGEFCASSLLLKALDEGRLGGVALDVFSHERSLAEMLRDKIAPPPDTPQAQEVEAVMRLAADPRVTLTPHNSFNTAEAVDRKASQSVQQLVCLAKHGYFVWPIPLLLDKDVEPETETL